MARIKRPLKGHSVPQDKNMELTEARQHVGARQALHWNPAIPGDLTFRLNFARCLILAWQNALFLVEVPTSKWDRCFRHAGFLLDGEEVEEVLLSGAHCPILSGQVGWAANDYCPPTFREIGSKPSRCARLRANLRCLRMDSAFCLALFSDGFSNAFRAFSSRKRPSRCIFFLRTRSA